jgi:nitrite reductase (NADH) large subunit
VVAGNGMAGMRTVEELLKLGIADRFQITVFGAEPRGNYNRILLSPVLSGEQQADDIMLHRPNWYAKRGITLHSGDPSWRSTASAALSARRTARWRSTTAADRRRVPIPIVLPLPGKELPGVVTFRDLDDVNQMLERFGRGSPRRGHRGWLVRARSRARSRLRGMHVPVVHLLDTLMEPPARRFRRAAAQGGARTARQSEFRMCARTREIVGGERVHGGEVRQWRGSGGRSRGPWRRRVGRTSTWQRRRTSRGPRGFSSMNNPSILRSRQIYAVGGASSVRRQTFGLVGAAVGTGAHLCAAHRGDSACRASRRHQLHAAQVSGSKCSPPAFLGAPNRESLVLSDNRRGIYKRVVLEGNKVCGAVLFGDVSEASRLRDLIADKTDIGPIRDQLLFDSSAACLALEYRRSDPNYLPLLRRGLWRARGRAKRWRGERARRSGPSGQSRQTLCEGQRAR